MRVYFPVRFTQPTQTGQFVHEDTAEYFLPKQKQYINGKVVAALGKLWSAYVHQRRILRETGLLEKGSPCISKTCKLGII